MNYSRRIFVSMFWVALGVILIICNIAGFIDEFWSGMGGGLIGGGIFRLIKQIKYRTNEEYREMIDVESSDERNKYIANKAWAWAGYLFVMIAALISVVFKIAGYDDLVPVTSGSVCLILVLYWGAYMYLRKKY
ncbi:hypothetical protein [Anaerosporobacter sp.]